MTTIRITDAISAIVDECDLPLFRQHSWYLHKSKQVRDNWYLISTVDRRTVYLHRLITGAKRGEHVDHIDGNGLNNSRSNLRLCTQSQNNANCYRANKTGFRGVVKDPTRERYEARIWVNGRRVRVGWFKTKEEAARARDRRAAEIYGEFARLNFPSAAA